MIMLQDEMLYFYWLALKTDFIRLNEYEEWLNNIFISDNEKAEIILDLQWCTANIEQTIETLYIYLFNKLSLLDYQLVGKILINQLEKKYYCSPDLLQELTHKLYNIWCLLPSHVSEQEPFFSLVGIDDPWSWGDKQQVVKNINWLFDYYRK